MGGIGSLSNYFVMADFIKSSDTFIDNKGTLSPKDIVDNRDLNKDINTNTDHFKGSIDIPGESDVPDIPNVPSGGGTTVPSNDNKISLEDGTKVFGSDIPIWKPDTNSSPEDNLNSLWHYITNLLSPNLDRAYNTSALNYLNTLNAMFASLHNLELGGWFDKATMITLAEKIADVAQSYVNAQFQSALSYQSWYLQQEYNSPLNQVNRLAEAGLNSAFAIGNLNSGNASSPAATPNIADVQQSNAGQVQAQEDAKRSSFLGEIFGAIAQMVPAVGGAAAALVNSQCMKMLAPSQIAKMGAETVQSATNALVLQNTADQVKQNMVFQVWNGQRQLVQQELDVSKGMVDSSKMAYDTAFNNSQYTVEQEESAWETTIVDKYGNEKTQTFTTQQLEDFINNHGQVDSDWRIKGSASWKLDGSFKVLGTGVDSSASVNIGGEYGKSKSNATDKGNKTSDTIGSYSEDGSSFHLGDSKFTSVTTRRRVPLPQFASHIKALYDRYQSAVDRFNTLSVGKCAYLNRLAEDLTRDISSLSAGTIISILKYQIESMFSQKPQTMVGD